MLVIRRQGCVALAEVGANYVTYQRRYPIIQCFLKFSRPSSAKVNGASRLAGTNSGFDPIFILLAAMLLDRRLHAAFPEGIYEPPLECPLTQVYPQRAFKLVKPEKFLDYDRLRTKCYCTGVDKGRWSWPPLLRHDMLSRPSKDIGM
ncbi:uncharacterized protein CLUP02_03771 [Colletotrichum lupini]|uniref:Uncharacterized protein n=1 Tax=Colletotrichum lupini TaxID=145971 RepID=A0A9Q8WCH2_9PEZI|nr:uncharacterized protein CLUP02_03771 [Colletotrichum lupini]UQC78294.1 hypothetical protein CLUP02_03771 [Colletotrichum lupini]